MLLFSSALAICLAAAHVLTAYLTSIHLTPRSRWLSFASGVSVAFVFLKLLPYLHDADAGLKNDGVHLLAYMFALAGLVGLYGLEIMVRRSRSQHRDQASGDPSGIFIVHLGAFALYNAFLGALLVDQMQQSVSQQISFILALLLHNAVNDFALREHHQNQYRLFGRWVLATSVLIGWTGAVLLEIPDVVRFSAISMLAGAIILNVLKEELPADRESRFGAFVGGCIAFTVLLVFSASG
jgi:hypothetical protein